MTDVLVLPLDEPAPELVDGVEGARVRVWAEEEEEGRVWGTGWVFQNCSSVLQLTLMVSLLDTSAVIQGDGNVEVRGRHRGRAYLVLSDNLGI